MNQRLAVASRSALGCLTSLALAALASCGTSSIQRRASVLEYLYPAGTQGAPATDVQLELPLRVAVAFVPENELSGSLESLEASEKLALLEGVRAAFAGTDDIGKIEIVPSSYLLAGGGFENIEQVQQMLGFDVIALLSYDQTQIDDMNVASITYWTIVGAYIVPGNENETHTLVDASVFDVRSRALLFNAAGKSVVKSSSSALGSEANMRENRREGMQLALDDLAAELDGALEAFRGQIRSGSVRGPGTPAISVSAARGADGSVGVGAFSGLDLAVILTLLGCLSLGKRSM